ncbi:glycosyl transferase family 2 [Pedobacter yonginense]|uniref:Glycosyl transferase family 2 n=1 Tax=Pedobacter yonginense TaxID=651869 RepID=A0A317EQQ9_9SPHI|nr:glycosyltransferase [Pedobacter yonginense]PWS29220.1 glycosyl transferase family 2 [Pedobacter yonginense]
MHSFPQVSLLITHYNRSESLEHLLKSYKNLNCSFGQIVVSDDGSKVEHLDKLNKLSRDYNFKLVTTPKNKGLGNNINKGQDAVDKPYTLYVQEDFEPSAEFPEKFKLALNFMEHDDALDIVKFYAYYPYPYLKPFSSDFSEMYINKFASNYTKIYYYTDHPHLRRSSFFTKFGRYPEGIKGDVTEYKMCISFIQNRGKGLFYNDYANLFLQKNSENEPSTMQRSSWKENPNFLIRVMRDVYRQIKYNYDILLMKSLKS